MCCIDVSQPQNVYSICTTMTVLPPPVTVEDNNKVNNTLTRSLFFSQNIGHNVVQTNPQIHKNFVDDFYSNSGNTTVMQDNGVIF